MAYEFRDEVPANTKKADKRYTLLKLGPGVITRINWFWPPGTHALGHACIYRFGSQVWPSNPEGDMTGDGYPVDLPVRYRLREEPYEFILHTWNEDDTYPHTFTIRFNLLPEEELPLLRDVLAAVASALTRVGGFLERVFTPPKRRK